MLCVVRTQQQTLLWTGGQGYVRVGFTQQVTLELDLEKLGIHQKGEGYLSLQAERTE